MSGTNARPLADLRARRTSIKWHRFEADVLPMSVAEMDFELAPDIAQTAIDHLLRSDTGYLDAPGPLAAAFAEFADSRWGWGVDESRVHLATDVTVGVLETLRLGLPATGGRVVLTPPVYAPFYEMVGEAHAEAVEVPLRADAGWSLDLPAIEQAFASGVDAILLCNPHNPTGRSHSAESLAELARLAATYDVLVVSDEVHAPLAHAGSPFTPFAVACIGAGARSVTVTSASKGWNLAALKCAVAIANDADTAAMLTRFPEELAARTSIIGLHANIAAYASLPWLNETVDRIAANLGTLRAEVSAHLPGVRVVEPDAGYLVWLDLRALGLGDDPAAELLQRARIALNSGPSFGAGGAGFARMNIACDPATIVEAVRRIASVLPASGAGVTEPVSVAVG
ncbi:MalY/PatB family protein [Leifsonia poae]|uniref:cysteine-S-conjugate beta-lyase n=1 Tax=Leifsonia poae TaxID=110933 RepID=A0A9W6HAF6_9MICO|nr:aminotransferase class I/II-fold pyridoxal phosphate-dependent enzyme [Leifsonia poae]GLJ76473.1 cystathionine beta-lyase [Leifsonia poae]